MSINKTKIVSLDNLPNSRDLLRATLKEVPYNPKNEKSIVAFKKNTTEFQYIFDKTLPENFFNSIDNEINGKNFEYINLDYTVAQSYNTASDTSTGFYYLDYVVNDDAQKILYDSVLSTKNVTQETEINNFYRYLDPLEQETLETNIKKFLKNEVNSKIIVEEIPDLIERQRLIQKNKIVFLNTDQVKAIEELNSRNEKFLPYYNKITIPLKNINKKNVSSNGTSIIENLTDGQKNIINTNLLFIQSQLTDVINTTNIFTETTGSGSTNSFFSIDLSVPSGMNQTLLNSRNLSPYRYDNKIVYFNNFVYTPPMAGSPYFNDFNSGLVNVYDRNILGILGFNNLATNIEVCYFKISKFFLNDVAPIQEIYLSYPSDPQKKSISYIDSQVISSKQYRYEVSVGVISYGMSYTYNKFEENNKIVYQILFQPKPRLIELPYFTDFINGIGISLQIPDMQFITQTKNRNLIKIAFNPITATETPIPLTVADTEYFDSLKKTQDGKILFLSNAIDFYNLHILDREPTDIIDFVNNSTVTKIDVKNNITAIQKSFSTDKKYYFLAVSRSNDGKQVSNPSFAYGLEFIKTSAAEVPIIRRYRFKNNLDKLSDIVLKEKNVKKLIKLTPSIFQTLVSEKAGLDGTYSFSDFKIDNFGNVLGNIWQENGDIANNGLKFKLRVTSKTTGKKIDINLNFQKDIITKFQK